MSKAVPRKPRRKRTILDDNRELLEAWAGRNPYGRVGAFVLDVDRLTSTDLTTSRADDYGAGWNAALATLRQRLGLPEKD